MSEGSETPRPLEFSAATAPPQPEPQRRPPREPFVLPKPPLWAQFAICFGLVAVVLTAIVIFVDHHNTNASNGLPIGIKAQAEDNREAAILASEDQAPHVFVVSGATAHQALVPVIQRDVRIQMNRVIDDGEATPPLEPARCNTTSGPAVTRGFSCTDLSGNQYFDFVGVIDAQSRKVTLCRRDPPTYGSASIPISPSCLAQASDAAATTSTS